MGRTERPGLTHHVLFALLAAGLLCLAGKLYLFQDAHHEPMVRRAAGQQAMVIPLPARRGNIYARSYSQFEMLAASHRVDGCFADPGLIDDADLPELCAKVGDVLSLEPSEVHERIVSRRGRRFVWLKRELTATEARRIAELRLPGIALQSQWRRRYPNGSLAAHVVGFVGVDGMGLEGVELVLDRHLRGIDGSNRVVADAARRPIWNQRDGYSPPQDGRHVYLTLDVVIQHHLEEVLADTVAEFAAESAVGVVVDPMTGEVLAMATVPTFDLSAFGNAPASARRNRVVTDMYEPGSIFKPFIAGTAMADGAVRWGETFHCHNGAWNVRRGRVLRDAYPYGTLSAEAVVYKSSNIGMAQMGRRLANPRMYEVIRGFGFGSPTGVGLPGEVGGQVNPLHVWTHDSTVSIPMGQEIAVTAMQMVMAFSALANDGILLRPRLVQAVVAPDGQVIEGRAQAIPVGRSLDAQTSRRFVREVLARVPTEGTGRRHARLDGWSSFGKTGTAQIAPYSSGEFVSSYIAGAPVESPRLVCLISVRKPDKRGPRGGGAVAGPAVKRVLERSLAYLGVPRDDEHSRPHDDYAVMMAD